MIEGYKFFNEGFKSKFGDIQYKVGKTYVHDGEIELCKSGFHFSEKLEDAFLYYIKNAKHCCIIEGNGQIIEDDNKIVCSEIYIKKELDFNNVLLELSKNKDWYVRAHLVRNKNCTIDILRKLSEDKDSYVRYFVAENENCSKDILEKLSKDKDCDIRYNVIENKNCTIDILRKLSGDENSFIRNKAIECLKELK